MQLKRAINKIKKILIFLNDRSLKYNKYKIKLLSIENAQTLIIRKVKCRDLIINCSFEFFNRNYGKNMLEKLNLFY